MKGTMADARRAGLGREGACLGVVLSAAFLLRFYGLALESAWFDEVSTCAYLDLPSLGDFLEKQAEVNPALPPLGLVVQWAWNVVAGPSVLSQRFLSLLFGILTLVPVYALSRRAFGNAAALAAVAWLALSPAHIYYSQEIRVYAMVGFLAALSMWSFDHFMVERKPSWGAWTTLFNLLLLWSHPFSVFVPITHTVFLGVFWRANRMKAACWGGAQILAILSLLPWYCSLHHSSLETNTVWLAKSSPLQAAVMLGEYAAGINLVAGHGTVARVLAAAVALVWLAGMLYLGLDLFTRPRHTAQQAQARYALFAAYLLAPPFLLAVLSCLYAPCLSFRYVAYAQLGAVLLFGAAWSAFHRRCGKVWSGTLFIVLAGVLLQYDSPRPFRQDFQAAAAIIREDPERADGRVWVMNPIDRFPMAYYLGRPPEEILTTPNPGEMAQVAATLPKGSGLWAIYPGDAPADILRGERHRFEKEAAAKGLRLECRTTAGRLPLAVYWAESTGLKKTLENQPPPAL